MIITIWLIINELISILENLGEMNIPLPGFLIKMIKSLKSKVEDNADSGKHFKEDEDERPNA
jgi:phage-related holin